MKISEAEFISQCLESNECTIEQFHDYFEVVPCNCEYENCEGWQIISKVGAVKKMREKILGRYKN